MFYYFLFENATLSLFCTAQVDALDLDAPVASEREPLPQVMIMIMMMMMIMIMIVIMMLICSNSNNIFDCIIVVFFVILTMIR